MPSDILAPVETPGGGVVGERWRWRIDRVRVESIVRADRPDSAVQRIEVTTRRLHAPAPPGQYRCEVGTAGLVLAPVSLGMPHVTCRHPYVDRLLRFVPEDHGLEPRLYESRVLEGRLPPVSNGEFLLPGLFLRIAADDSERAYPYPYVHGWNCTEKVRHLVSPGRRHLWRRMEEHARHGVDPEAPVLGRPRLTLATMG